MDYIEAQFLTSASSKEGWPESNLPQVLFAGRSNVGKSSLINTLCNRKQLAYVGNTPGKTRLLNFFNIQDRLVLVDAPGYGYAMRNRNEIDKFGKMMDEYFHQCKTLKGLVQIVDYRHKPTKDDIDMIEYARDCHLPIIVCATKKDKCKNSELSKLKKQISETLQVPLANIIDFSSATREGQEKLWDKINELIK